MSQALVLMDVLVRIEGNKLFAAFPDGTYQRARVLEEFVGKHRPEMDYSFEPHCPTTPAQNVIQLVWSADVHHPVVHEYEVTGPLHLLQEVERLIM